MYRYHDRVRQCSQDVGSGNVPGSPGRDMSLARHKRAQGGYRVKQSDGVKKGDGDEDEEEDDKDRRAMPKEGAIGWKLKLGGTLLAYAIALFFAWLANRLGPAAPQAIFQAPPMTRIQAAPPPEALPPSVAPVVNNDENTPPPGTPNPPARAPRGNRDVLGDANR
jgi:hypothetical protein